LTHEPGQRVEVSQGLPSQRRFPAVPGSVAREAPAEASLELFHGLAG
jgi:hypothetical protein